MTAAKTLGIYAALLTSHALVNCFMVRWLRWLNNLSILLHSVGVSCLCISLLAKAPKLQSAKFVFATFYDGTGGWSIRASPAYVACIGILLAQYTITGFVSSAAAGNKGRIWASLADPHFATCIQDASACVIAIFGRARTCVCQLMRTSTLSQSPG